MVGLSLMNMSLCSTSVSPPKTSTMIAVTTRHDREVPRQRIGDAERGQHRHHEDAGRGENAELRIGGEEQHQRPDVERELERGLSCVLRHDAV